VITGTELKGSDHLAATLDTAARKTADMAEAAREAAEIVAAAGAAEAPLLTGRLSGSLRVTTSGRNTGTITSPLAYAVPIHWGRPAHNIAPNPFLIRAAEREETDWTHAYEAALQRNMDAVKGA
jgi:hypothetical protein